MKTTIFAIIFCIAAIPSFSQGGAVAKPDTTRIDLSSYADLSQLRLHNQKQGFELLKPRDFTVQLKKPLGLSAKFKSNDKINGPIENRDAMYGMPIMKPEIIDRMPIHVPDSTISYSLRIKEIK